MSEHKPIYEKSKRETLRTLEEVRQQMERADEGWLLYQGTTYWLVTSKRVGEIENITRWKMPRSVFMQAQRVIKRMS